MKPLFVFCLLTVTVSLFSMDDSGSQMNTMRQSPVRLSVLKEQLHKACQDLANCNKVIIGFTAVAISVRLVALTECCGPLMGFTSMENIGPTWIELGLLAGTLAHKIQVGYKILALQDALEEHNQQHSPAENKEEKQEEQYKAYYFEDVNAGI